MENIVFKPNTCTNRRAEPRRGMMWRAVSGIGLPVPRLPRPTRLRARICTRHFRRPPPSDYRYTVIP